MTLNPLNLQLPKQSWQQRKMIHHSLLKARYNPRTELNLKIHPWLQIPYQQNPGKMWRMMLWTSSRRYLFTNSSEAAVDIKGQLGHNVLLWRLMSVKNSVLAWNWLGRRSKHSFEVLFWSIYVLFLYNCLWWS